MFLKKFKAGHGFLLDIGFRDRTIDFASKILAGSFLMFSIKLEARIRSANNRHYRSRLFTRFKGEPLNAPLIYNVEIAEIGVWEHDHTREFWCRMQPLTLTNSRS